MNPSQGEPPIELDHQRRFWNTWNAQNRSTGWKISYVYARQAQMVKQWLTGLGRNDLDILEVGCGSGWLCEQLTNFGRVTGTDLANEVIPPDRSAQGGPTFVAGDFFKLGFPRSGFDVVVSLEVLAHVEDQHAYVAKIADLLRPGGHLMLATQNSFTLTRWSEVAPKGPGQVRKWVSAGELRALLSTHFGIQTLTSIVPVGDRGILRWINAPKVMRALSLVVAPEYVDALKERLLLGRTLMVLARKSDRGRTA
jgi:2-polyprenyl-3-methyl-5-hydroxy-6-metoxy-1,4-benzoquinol methylase